MLALSLRVWTPYAMSASVAAMMSRRSSGLVYWSRYLKISGCDGGGDSLLGPFAARRLVACTRACALLCGERIRVTAAGVHMHAQLVAFACRRSSLSQKG
jgi:hypothetical protein